jgi:hypothetical protein
MRQAGDCPGHSPASRRWQIQVQSCLRVETLSFKEAADFNPQEWFLWYMTQVYMIAPSFDKLGQEKFSKAGRQWIWYEQADWGSSVNPFYHPLTDLRLPWPQPPPSCYRVGGSKSEGARPCLAVVSVSSWIERRSPWSCS